MKALKELVVTWWLVLIGAMGAGFCFCFVIILILSLFYTRYDHNVEEIMQYVDLPFVFFLSLVLLAVFLQKRERKKKYRLTLTVKKK